MLLLFFFFFPSFFFFFFFPLFCFSLAFFLLFLFFLGRLRENALRVGVIRFVVDQELKLSIFFLFFLFFLAKNQSLAFFGQLKRGTVEKQNNNRNRERKG